MCKKEERNAGDRSQYPSQGNVLRGNYVMFAVVGADVMQNAVLDFLSSLRKIQKFKNQKLLINSGIKNSGNKR
jgi:hypothetical protein